MMYGYLIIYLCENKLTYRGISWGESAGAVSVGLHIVTNGGDTEGLFRAGFMNSGFPMPTDELESGKFS
jgi:hypothetical protein